jgi:acyl-CoA hydrolase
MSESSTRFRAVLDAVDVVDGHASFDCPADWAQGRSTFGGLVVAAGLKALRAQAGPVQRPRSVQAAFLKPLVPGAAEISLGQLRRGRSTTYSDAVVSQQGEACATVGAVFGRPRDSALRVDGPPPPAVPPPDGVVEFPQLAGVTPEFIRHFALRWTIGQAPFTQARDPEVGGWCRFRADQGLGDEEAVLALIDAWPAPVLPLLDRPAPASSATWSVAFLDFPLTSPSDGWWLFHARTVGSASGYAQTQATLWSPERRAVAISQQLVAVFDGPA